MRRVRENDDPNRLQYILTDPCLSEALWGSLLIEYSFRAEETGTSEQQADRLSPRSRDYRTRSKPYRN
jgi:hypothetical protein